jgi:transcriptional regulator with XRE-family HTH domain
MRYVLDMPQDATTDTDAATKSAALGSTFREAREGAGLSARQLAKSAGIDHSTLSRWERGERHISEATYRALMSLLVAHLAGRSAA